MCCFDLFFKLVNVLLLLVHVHDELVRVLHTNVNEYICNSYDEESEVDLWHHEHLEESTIYGR